MPNVIPSLHDVLLIECTVCRHEFNDKTMEEVEAHEEECRLTWEAGEDGSTIIMVDEDN